MKLLLLIVSLGIITSLSSCQSEYERQLTKAKELAKQELRLKQSLNFDNHFNVRSAEALSNVQEEIAFCAHLSGNERLFLSQIESFKSTVKMTPIENNILITKYP